MWSTVVWVSALAAAAAAGSHPRCADAERCRLLNTYDQTREFEVEGKKVTVEFGEYVKVDCNGWAALDSKAMPSFTSEISIPKVTLRSCPSSAAGGTFLSVLSALNVTLLHSDLEKTLVLEELPQHPPLQELAQCDELQQLVLSSPAVEALPERWVARCSILDHLSITHANSLRSLNPKTLVNTTALQFLSITDGVIESLPLGLLDDMPNLIFLNLSNNHLQMLPSGLFAKQGALQLIDLKYNLLTPEGVAAVGEVRSLERLGLSYNPRLTDLCNSSSDFSPFLHLKKLWMLLLVSTNITRICRDWREELTALEMLDLGNTQITELRCTDLMYTRGRRLTNRAKVELRGTAVTRILCSEAEYNATLVAPRSGAEVRLDGAPLLRCDCAMHWARRALLPPGGPAPAPPPPADSRALRVRGLMCSSGRRLTDVPADELKCAA